MKNLQDPQEKVQRLSKRVKFLRKRMIENSAKNVYFAKNKELTIVSSLLKIYKEVEEKGLKSTLFENLSEEFEYVMAKLGVSPLQVLFLAILMEKESTIDEISFSLRVTRLNILLFINELDSLEKQHFIRKKIFGYSITDYAEKIILANENFTPPNYEDLSHKDFFKALCSCFSNSYDFDEMSQKVSLLLEKNDKMPFVKVLTEYQLSDIERMFLLYQFGLTLFESVRYNGIRFSQIYEVNLLKINFEDSNLKREKLLKQKEYGIFYIPKKVLRHFLGNCLAD